MANKKTKSSTDRHKGKPYSTRLLPPIAAEMEKLAESQRRSYSNMIEMLVEEALQSRRES
jgi:hypothetical protein